MDYFDQIVLGVLGLASLTVFVYGLFSAWIHFRIWHFCETNGIVEKVELEEIEWKDGDTTLLPRIEVRYEWDNVQYCGSPFQSFWPGIRSRNAWQKFLDCNLRPGTPVRVYLDNSNPSRFTLQQLTAAQLAIAFALVGVSAGIIVVEIAIWLK